jgi:hypothetical protein
MSAELFASITAFLRGFSTVPTRRGLQQSMPRIVLGSALIFVGIIFLLL